MGCRVNVIDVEKEGKVPPAKLIEIASLVTSAHSREIKIKRALDGNPRSYLIRINFARKFNQKFTREKNWYYEKVL